MRAVISAASRPRIRPSLSVLQTVPSRRQETRSSAFFSAEAAGSVEQAGRKPFEADRHLPQFAIEAGNDTIDQATADECFTNDRA